MIREEKFDFLFIPIPSFYCALLGRILHNATGIRYGIDYIDPWVHAFPGAKGISSRAWWATKLADVLEPIAVKKASLITGVAEGYYLPVLKRNKSLRNVFHGAMPYGGEATDHDKLKSLHIKPYLFQKKPGKFQLLYAGAMLPKAYEGLERIFKTVNNNRAHFSDLEIHFIGTGKSPNDSNGFNIKPLAEKYNIWQSVVFEYPARIAYLEVLIHLENADGIFILGSTEPHYTPSKTYQAVLSKKPLLAVLHKQSLAVTLLEKVRLGSYIFFDGEKELNIIEEQFLEKYLQYRTEAKHFNADTIDMALFEQYSAKSVTEKLASLLNKAVNG